MKRFILEISLILLSLFLLISPTIISYSNNCAFPPLLLTWVVPFFLIFFNIYLSNRYKSKFMIWRIISSLTVLLLGHGIRYNYVLDYFENKGSEVDFWTTLITQYELAISIVLIVISLSMYQIITLINRCISNRKEKRNIDR